MSELLIWITCSDEIADGFWHLVLESIEDGSCSYEVELALQLADEWLHGLFFVLQRKSEYLLAVGCILILRNVPHGYQ